MVNDEGNVRRGLASFSWAQGAGAPVRVSGRTWPWPSPPGAGAVLMAMRRLPASCHEQKSESFVFHHRFLNSAFPEKLKMRV